MSRSLGKHSTRVKARGNDQSPESLGRAAFSRGEPQTANPWLGGLGDKGKGHAWNRGWTRARMAAAAAART